LFSGIISRIFSRSQSQLYKLYNTAGEGSYGLVRFISFLEGKKKSKRFYIRNSGKKYQEVEKKK